MDFTKIFRLFTKSGDRNIIEFSDLFDKFRLILEDNNKILETMADLEDKLSGEYIFDIHYLEKITASLSDDIYNTISCLNILTNNKYPKLAKIQSQIQTELESITDKSFRIVGSKRVFRFCDIGRDDDGLVGSKNAFLADIKNHFDYTIPSGFAVSAAGYNRFMEYNGLYDKIGSVVEQSFTGEKFELSRGEEESIRQLFNAAEFPRDLKKDICKELKHICKSEKKGCKFAVRSSAVGEDESGRSYAGQFRSLLNISSDMVLTAYKKILASRFHCLPYVQNGSLKEILKNVPMAVSIQEMIPAQKAGVVYSLDPSDILNNSIIISALYGLGIPVVSGTMNSDFWRISRLNLSKIIDQKTVMKEEMVKPGLLDGVRTVPVPELFRDSACLTNDEVFRIAEIAFILDRYYKKPQDIEWAIDNSGDIVILQIRPLSISDSIDEKPEPLQEKLKQYEILLNKKGTVANRGIAAGKVCFVTDDTDLHEFPAGAIAVSKLTSPRLSRIIKKAAAIITDVGSSTGHMATIAREFGVPAIVGTENATETLADGIEITVDAQENIVYHGIIHELIAYEIAGKDVYIDMPEYRMLRRMLKRIAPLNLIDPGSRNFSAENCRTYHDIIRFAHEKAMQELINLNISSKTFPDVTFRELTLPIPLGLKVIDIGNGLQTPDEKENTVHLDQVISLPMKAVLQGLTGPLVWSTEPVDLGMEDLISSITKYSMSDSKLAYQGQNLAVISDYYMNLSLRLGYHFNVIDAYVSPNINDNYIYFRFVGGVTVDERKHRRALVIMRILEKNDFKVIIHGDLLVGKVKKKSEAHMHAILVSIGKLIGFTRQLDTRMRSDDAVEHYTNSFFQLAETDSRPDI